VNGPGSAREALIAEAIGDLARLLDRAEALLPAMIETHGAIVAAQSQLAAQLDAFDSHVAALAEKAKVQVVKHIIARTEDAARRSQEIQVQAMARAAQTLFRSEIEPALRRLAQQLGRPWERWLTYAATAMTASAATWAMALSLWAR